MIFARFVHALALAGGGVMLTAALVVVVSVSLRWFAGSPISGDYEIVQVATAIAAFAFLPYCQLRRGNIVVDTFTTRLPERARRGLDALWDLVYLIAAGIIAWRLAIGGYDAIRSNTVSMILALPTGWAIVAAAVLAGVLCLVAGVTLVRLLRGWR